MICNFLIFCAELRKLGLLYLAIKYNLHDPIHLIIYWLIWQLLSAILMGKLSDIIGRKRVLSFTVCFSILVSLLARQETLFNAALLMDGLLVATLPVTFATKNDLHPLRNKRLTYAEASLARAFPWFLFPLIYLWVGMPKQFWEITLLASGLISGVLMLFFKDPEDKNCENEKTHPNKEPLIFCSFIVVFLFAFFISECSYQTIPYLAEAKEPIAKLMKSYLLFGLGMSLTCALQLIINRIKKINLTKICMLTFLLTFIYFFINFLFFSSWKSENLQDILDKITLGIASGIYIPIIYAIVCQKFRQHQQGFLCGLIDATGTCAEILAPWLAYILLALNAPLNKSLLIIGFGFLLAYGIIAIYHHKHIDSYEKNH